MQSIDCSWSKAVIYQIYPRSFKDSNSDGIGDLKGIIQKIDYLSYLGINAVWISPVYNSPMIDFGYDVSDYCKIDPIFGNLKDFDLLVKEAHKRKIKIIMDYIPSHTSTKHPWFLESRSSKENPKRDWYIWKNGKSDGNLPNNWLSVFGGSRWKLDKKTNQYYLHTFLTEQADLNWRNRKVKEAMLDVLKFWLERGADGFRVDAFDHIFKDQKFLDEPPNPNYRKRIDDPFDSQLHIYTTGQPELYDLIKVFSNVLKEYGEKFMITESYVDLQALTKLYKAGDMLHAPFNFQFIQLPWSATHYKEFIDEFDRAVGPNYLPTYVLGNHDRSRVATRVGSQGARTAAMLQLTLRGIPTIYYGDEIGMTDGVIPKEKVQDPFEKNVPGQRLGRDPERTPMQWNSERNAGFSNVEPWLPISSGYKKINVESESKTPKSMLNLYKKLIHYRQKSNGLLFGKYNSTEVNNKEIFAYSREFKNEKLIILLNFSNKEQHLSLPTQQYGRLVCNTYLDKKDNAKLKLNSLVFRPYEGYMLNFNL